MNVPKFSSFKSKQPASSGKKVKTEDPVKEGHVKSKHTGSERHRRDRQQRSGHRDIETRQDATDRTRQSSKTQSSSRKSAQGLPNRTSPGLPGVFVIDTKGDPLIRKYGGIDKSQVPAYYRYGGGRVLGTEGRLVIHRDGARDMFSLRMPGEGSALFQERDGLRSKRPQVSSVSVKLRAKRKRGAGDASESDPGEFISVRKSKKPKQGDGADSSDDGYKQPSYRSIEGMAKARAAMVDSSDASSESEADEIRKPDHTDKLAWRSFQLNNQTREHPEDIDAWFKLVDHQDSLMRVRAATDEGSQEDRTHSFTEIKVSMLESALSNASNPRDRERVLTRLMQEGVKVWTTKTSAKKWTEIAAEVQNNFSLWKTHLDFSMSDIGTFQYDSVKKMLIDRLHYVTSNIGEQNAVPGFEEAIYIFLRLTRFVHDAGYKELAVASWQAILELNFFRPSSIRSQVDALESFEEFWESEVPRVGENGSQGWKHFHESGGSGDAPEPLKDTTWNVAASRDIYKEWRNVEAAQAERAKLPARTMDEGNDDDPFRVVIFSDVKSMLFLIPETVFGSVAPRLLDAMLLFAGYPPSNDDNQWTRQAYNDQFLTHPLTRVDLNEEQKSWETNPDEQPKPIPAFARDGLQISISPHVLFSGQTWFQYLPVRNGSSTVDVLWVQNTLEKLIPFADLPELTQYFLGLCLKTDPTSIKKVGKRLLKQQPTNLGLYDSYARAELANGNAVAANKVLSSTTEAPSFVVDPHVLLLYLSWTWEALDSGDLRLAKKRLCFATAGKTSAALTDFEMTISSVNECVQRASNLQIEALLTGKGDDIALYTECTTLHEYLSQNEQLEPHSDSQGNITLAMAFTERVSRDLVLRGLGPSAAHENILQNSAKLLYYHTQRGPFRRAFVRENLSRFIQLFPRNTMFLSLYEWADTGLRVIDDTRDILEEHVLVPPGDCVSSRVFAIHHELSRGNPNTVDAAFEHAVFSDSSRNSPAVWIAFIRYCYSQKKQLRRKTKKVFYRALRHCPWSKDIAMEAFVTLLHDMESSELREVYNTMTAKGFRVHVDLDEMLNKGRDK